MLDLETERPHQLLRQMEPPVAEKPPDDEVAVPAIHFVKSAPWDNVTVLEIEQAGRIDRLGRVGSQMAGGRGQILDLYFATILELLHGFRHGKFGRNIKLR